MHQGLEKRACREDNRPGPIQRIATGRYADNALDCSLQIAACRFVFKSRIRNLRSAVFQHQPFDNLLPEREVGLGLDPVLHRELILLLIRLGPGRMHGRALGPVEHAELNAGGVDDLAHLAAERVDLADDLALGDTADGRVAAHLGDGISAHGQESRAQAHPRRRQRRLHARMAGTDDDDIKIVNE